jgi:hypothetical protein
MAAAPMLHQARELSASAMLRDGNATAAIDQTATAKLLDTSPESPSGFKKSWPTQVSAHGGPVRS